MNKFPRFLKNCLFPPRCIGCGELIDPDKVRRDADEVICEPCRIRFEDAKRERCPECWTHVSSCTCSRGFDGRNRKINVNIPKLIFYHPGSQCIQNNVIYELKHRYDKRIAEFLADELSSPLKGLLDGEGIAPRDCIFTFVPRRYAAVGKYGFDQGLLLARGTARALGVEENCRRIFSRRGGREQKKLDAKARRENVKNFLRLGRGAKDAVSGKAVVIIDDLFTTGATLNTAARMLSEAGAARVFCAVVARDLPAGDTRK